MYLPLFPAGISLKLRERGFSEDRRSNGGEPETGNSSSRSVGFWNVFFANLSVILSLQRGALGNSSQDTQKRAARGALGPTSEGGPLGAVGETCWGGNSMSASPSVLASGVVPSPAGRWGLLPREHRAEL